MFTDDRSVRFPQKVSTRPLLSGHRVRAGLALCLVLFSLTASKIVLSAAYYSITDDEWPAVKANLQQRLA